MCLCCSSQNLKSLDCFHGISWMQKTHPFPILWWGGVVALPKIELKISAKKLVAPQPGVGMGDGMLTTPVPVFCSNQKSFPKTREMYYMIFVAVILRNKPNVCDTGCVWGSPFFSLYLHSILREMDFKPQNDCPQTPCPGDCWKTPALEVIPTLPGPSATHRKGPSAWFAFCSLRSLWMVSTTTLPASLFWPGNGMVGMVLDGGRIWRKDLCVV